MKKGIPLVVAGMTILAAGRSAHGGVAAKTFLMIRPFQAKLPLVMQLRISLDLRQVFRGKTLIGMAALAGNRLRFCSNLMAAGAVRIGGREPGCVVMALCAAR